MFFIEFLKSLISKHFKKITFIPPTGDSDFKYYKRKQNLKQAQNNENYL